MSERKYLTQNEVSAIVNAASQRKYAERDCCLIMLAYFHGFRVSELLSLRLSDVNLSAGSLYVRRLKNGFSTIHPLQASEVKVIRSWLAVRKTWLCRKPPENHWLFISRAGNPLSRQYFYAVLRQAGEDAGLSLRAHPHMLRHACGYALADNGVDTRLIQDYLGHRNIRHTVRYTASNAARFDGIWTPGRRRGRQLFDPKCNLLLTDGQILSDTYLPRQ
ncbi:pilus assembly protein [Salmonella enterica]|nr:pilus assembly protein [Salmonella enterica]